MSFEHEKLLVCPYNPAHSILKYRMQVHLHKCRKQHESLDWGYCSHNSTHHMPLAELEYHEKHLCENRHSFQSSVFNFAPQEKESLAPIVHIDLPETEENWDDGQENHFDPKKNASEKCIIRGVHCVPPSERLAFKLAHRKQLQERLEEAQDTRVSRAKMRTEPMKQMDPSRSLEPLRPPKELPKGFTPAQGSSTRAGEKNRSPGSLNDMVNLSLSSHEELPDPVEPRVARNGWSGLGRGRPIQEPSAPALPPTNAWGRGRPMF